MTKSVRASGRPIVQRGIWRSVDRFFHDQGGGGSVIANDIDFTSYASQSAFVSAFTAAPYTFARAGDAYVRDVDTYLKVAGTNEPRMECDEYGLPLGYLSEPAATNLLTYSQQFDNADWIKQSASVTANAATSPANDLTADLIYPDTTGAGRGIYQSHTLTSSADYVLSVFAKAQNMSWLKLVHQDGAGNYRRAWFDLSNGLVGTVESGATAGMTPYADGWYYCWIVANTGVGGAASGENISLADGDNDNTTTANGTDGIYIWQADLVAASAPSSPILTTSASAARAADSLYRDITGELDEGGWMAAESVGSVSANSYWVEAYGDSSNRVALYSSNGASRNMYAADGGVNQSSPSSPGNVSDYIDASAVRWLTDSFVISGDGSLGVADTSGSVPSGLTQLHINKSGGGNVIDARVVPRVSYGNDPSRSDAQLQLDAIPKAYRAHFARMTQAEAEAILTTGIWTHSRASSKWVFNSSRRPDGSHQQQASASARV